MAEASKNIRRSVTDESILAILRDYQEHREFSVTCGARVTHSDVQAEGVMEKLRDGEKIAERKEFNLSAYWCMQEEDDYYDKWYLVMIIEEKGSNSPISWEEFEQAEHSWRSFSLETFGAL